MDKRLKVNDMDFYEFISRTENCKWGDIVNEFSHQNRGKEEGLSEKQIFIRLRKLIEKGYIFHKNRGDIYNINPFQIPDKIKQHELEKKKSKFWREINQYEIQAEKDLFLRNAIQKNTKINPVKDLYFTDKMHEIFNELLFSLLVICYLCNPDNWYHYKSPKDLKNSLLIELNWDADERIFEYLDKYKKRCYKDNYLYPLGFSEYDLKALNVKERKKYLFPTYTDKNFLERAIGQALMRERQRKQNKFDIINKVLFNNEKSLEELEAIFKTPTIIERILKELRDSGLIIEIPSYDMIENEARRIINPDLIEPIDSDEYKRKIKEIKKIIEKNSRNLSPT